MGRTINIMLAVMVTASSAYAADDAVTRAMKLLEKRHYEEAAGVLRGDPALSDPAKQGTANLALGMAYFKNAVLHRELYQASLSASQDYLKKLSAAQGRDRSRFVDLFLGDLLVEIGKPGIAASSFEKLIATEGVDPRYQAIAKVGLGLSHHLSNDAAKATALWAAIDTADPEVKAELAAAYSRAGILDKSPLGMVDESLAASKKSGKPVSMRMLKNAVAVYARSTGLTEKGLDLLKRSDLKSFSFRETLGKSKVINFYDLSLLGDMATLYGQASLSYLGKAVGDAKTKDAAEYYLGQAHALFGSLDQSGKVTASFIAASKMPASYKDRVRVWQGANAYQKNRDVASAMGIWDELSRKQPEDPDVLAEILSACGRLKVECPKIVQKGASAVDAGDSKKTAPLNVAMGRYYLGKLDNARAVAYLEAGRDKSNKNKIEANEPVTLVNLAEAYFRTKKFSEALEIYFEMSKQFPEVRQLQEAMQGVYAMEHKSAGDVKIN